MTRLRTGIVGCVIGIALVAPATAGAATINVVAGMGEGGEDDQCSLREAIQTANANSAVNNGGAGADCTVGQAVPDTINLPAGTYTIAATSDEGSNVSGDYDIQVGTGNLSIVGAGSGTTTIDANDHDRAMEAFGSGSFGLSGVTLTDGTTTNAIGGGGGGLQISSGTAGTLTDVAITASFATNISGGGLALNSTAAQTLTRVTVTGNASNGIGTGPSGGGINAAGGAVSIADSTISGNTSTHTAGDTLGIGLGGGGINFDSGAVGTITRTTISGNTATTAEVTQFPGGGGIAHEGAAGNLTISDSTISGNNVSGGGSRSGGGIDWNSSTPSLDQLRIDNTTISGNSVTSAASSTGGGIKAVSGTVDVANATITANTAEAGGGDGVSISTNNLSNGSTFDFRASILDEGGTNECDVVGINAAFNSLGYSMERGATNDCAFAGTGDSVPVATPIAGALASNGGPTQTFANLAAARDVIPVGNCVDSAGAAQADDQRGVPRPFNSNCDVGAYEHSECGSTVVNIVGTGGDDTLTGTAGNDGILGLEGADTITGGDGSDGICLGGGDDSVLADTGSDTDQVNDGGGTDTYSLANLSAATRTVSVGSGLGSTNGPDIGSDFLFDVENATGSAGNDTLSGDEVVNVLAGGDGDDIIDGGAADDTLIGGEGGETNGDTMSFVSQSVAINFDLAGASPQSTGAGNDTWSQMENATGGNAADTLRGDSGNNSLNGGFGAPSDTLEGRAGDDTLDGSSSADGAGDAVVYDEAASGVTVDLSNASAQNTGDGTDTITDTESVTGSANNDVLTSSSASNVFDGGGGNDRAAFTAAAAGVTANLATDSATGDGTDTLTSVENLEGSPNVDTLTGDDGINFLIGGAGGDTLTGAGGADQVNAGVGGDSILIRDSIGDTADCGPDVDADTVQADLMGTDVLTSCDGTDTVSFEAPPSGGGGGTTTTPVTTTPTKPKCKKGRKLKKVKGKFKCVKKKRKKK